MRLLIQLKALADGLYNDSAYNHKMQGVIYSCLKDTPLGKLHEFKKPKLFCFSNLFPIGNFRQGDVRNLLISSPNIELLTVVYKKIVDQIINVGNMRFKVVNAKFLEPRVKSNCVIHTATPIVIRFSGKDLEKVFAKPMRNVYWRPPFPQTLFLEHLERNILEKFGFFVKTDPPQISLFSKAKAKLLKTVSKVIVVREKRFNIIGSLWRFHFKNLTPTEKALLKFAVDSGFGELNSLGFGFVNVEVKK